MVAVAVMVGVSMLGWFLLQSFDRLHASERACVFWRNLGFFEQHSNVPIRLPTCLSSDFRRAPEELKA